MYAHMYESLQMFTWGHLCIFMFYMHAHMRIHTAFHDAKALGGYCHLKQLGELQGLKILSYHTSRDLLQPCTTGRHKCTPGLFSPASTLVLCAPACVLQEGPLF